MPASHFLTLLHASSRSSIPKPTRSVICNPIKKFGEMSKGNNGRLVEERAPSTAEEFQRVAEEKAREAQQGTGNQTTGKTYEGTEEATMGDTKVGSVKNRYKDHESGTKNRRRGD